jgi:hypothetical protein
MQRPHILHFYEMSETLEEIKEKESFGLTKEPKISFKLDSPR